MKAKAIISAVALMASSQVFASSSELTAESCVKVENSATLVMKMRQAGVPMATLMREFTGESDGVVRKMITNAYATPRYSSDSFIDRSVSDFSSRYALECYRLVERVSQGG